MSPLLSFTTSGGTSRASPAPGPVAEETFWQQPDMDKLWLSGKSVDTLKPTERSFPGYAAYVAASVERYVHTMERRDAFAATPGFYRDHSRARSGRQAA
ncbi:uncharacterized protein PpBr36_10179 [Pyricularia pennisetigena]|uniref:uncharacterized protein n=1 Tax=Pyricularia pennisetigena TaxID=1578925 RepID=UPI001153D2E8|nr:uncharacterized protein PpBr36_10179 [Pyricularia pennisetigena]TLS21569.1 hypothetical protein PpBr36_10179 [Pyricularia pennisetigena]